LAAVVLLDIVPRTVLGYFKGKNGKMPKLISNEVKRSQVNVRKQIWKMSRAMRVR
jgi:hypothetical protein